MYVSRAVRPMAEDPPGDPVSLVLRTDEDTDPGTVVAAVAELGGERERDLGFGDVPVTVPGPSIPDLLELDGLRAVETDALTDATDADGAGEDVEAGDGG
jgi:hypothetical protein